MGCAACQIEVLREARTKKDLSMNARGKSHRKNVLKRTEESWAAGNVRCQTDKIAIHEKSGMHKLCYPRWARSQYKPGWERYTADCVKYGLLHPQDVDMKEDQVGKFKIRHKVSLSKRAS